MHPERDDPSDPPVAFGDSLQWSEVDEVEQQRRAQDPGHRQRLRLLVGGCVVGALVIIAVTVFGVRALVSDLDRQTPRERTIATIKARYENTYDTCVSRGGASKTCSEQAARACVIDPRWRDDEAEQLTQTCVFGPRP